MIPWLDPDNVRFPPVDMALEEPDGLLAAGGNLAPQTLLQAYRRGIFPWYEAPDPILWWSPDPRAVIIPAEVHVSKSMRKFLRKAPYRLSCDSAFIRVMQCCAAPRNYTEQTWIGVDMINAYNRLHEKGYAHSVEAWLGDQLVGGLYGVAIGCMFFGESMFSRADNASKFAFIHLARELDRAGFTLIDCQVASDHMASLGAKNMPRDDFQLRLKEAINKEPAFSPWTMTLP